MEGSYSRPQMRPPGRPVGDLRTPVAWRQREYNLNHHQLQEQEEPFGQYDEEQRQQQQPSQPHSNHHHHHQQQHHQQPEDQQQWRRAREQVSSVSPPVSSTDEGGADGDESSELDTSVSGQRLQRRHQQQQLQQLHQQRHRQRHGRISQSHYAVIKSQTMTMRSTRSVPALDRFSWPNTNMVNCPVHGSYKMQPGLNPRLQQQQQQQQQQQLPQSAFPLLYVGKGVGNGPMRRAGSLFDMRPTGCDHLQLPQGYARTTSPMYGSLMRSMPIVYGPTPPPPLPPPPLFCTLEKGKKSSHYGSVRSLHSLHPLSGGVGGSLPSAMLPIGPLAIRPPIPMQPLPPPPPYNLPPMPPLHLLPPGMRPRPLVIPAAVEPLPVRDPAKSQAINGHNALMSGKGDKGILDESGRIVGDYGGGSGGKRRCHCCRGPVLPMIWFIVCTVTIGVIVGVVLGSIYG